MQIVIPMAGAGKRFLDAGYKDIKPLILVHGRPMVQHVAEFFPGEENFLFICSNEHLQDIKVKSILQGIKPGAKITGIDFKPRHGVVYAVLWAKEYIHDDEPIIFSYCDYNIHWDYEGFKNFTRATGADGVVLSYSGFHPHLLGPNFYEGVNIDESGKIKEIKEKHSFSLNKQNSWHSCGLYYFKSGRLAKKYFERHLKSPPHENGEYYISTVYNELIKDGLTCLSYPLEFFCQWGTPEDLAEYTMWTERARNLYEPKDAIEKQTLEYWKKYLSLT